MFLFYRFRSTCVTNVENSLRRSAVSPATRKPTSNCLKHISTTSAEKNSAVPIIRNATRNPTTIRLPVLFVVNILIQGKTCSVTGLCTKDQRPSRDHRWRDLHPLGHPIVLQSDHEFTVTSLPTLRQPSVQDEPETRILYLRHWNTIQYRLGCE